MANGKPLSVSNEAIVSKLLAKKYKGKSLYTDKQGEASQIKREVEKKAIKAKEEAGKKK